MRKAKRYTTVNTIRKAINRNRARCAELRKERCTSIHLGFCDLNKTLRGPDHNCYLCTVFNFPGCSLPSRDEWEEDLDDLSRHILNITPSGVTINYDRLNFISPAYRADTANQAIEGYCGYLESGMESLLCDLWEREAELKEFLESDE